MAGHSGETQGLRVEEPVVSQPSLISNVSNQWYIVFGLCGKD